MKKILVFGNPQIEKDNLSLKFLPKLKKTFPGLQFKQFDPTESLEHQGKNLVIIDAVEDINNIKVINLKNQQDFEKLHLPKSYSMHDFDLAYNLKILKMLNKIDSVKVIGIPMYGNEKIIFEEIKKFIKNDLIYNKPI